VKQFCIYLTSYRGNKLPPFYVGSSSTKQIARGYHGSVKSRRYRKIWEAEIEHHPEMFRTQVVALYDTRQEAYDAEERLHRRLDIIKNPMHINLALANRRFNTGEGQSPETIAKAAESRRGKKAPPRTDQWRARQAAAKLGKKASPETKAKMSLSRLGVKLGQRDPNKREVVCAKMRAARGRKICVGGVEYRSITDASEALGISHYLVKKAANALSVS
jgi:hypothetical protein